MKYNIYQEEWSQFNQQYYLAENAKNILIILYNYKINQQIKNKVDYKDK